MTCQYRSDFINIGEIKAWVYCHLEATVLQASSSLQVPLGKDAAISPNSTAPLVTGSSTWDLVIYTSVSQVYPVTLIGQTLWAPRNEEKEETLGKARAKKTHVSLWWPLFKDPICHFKLWVCSCCQHEHTCSSISTHIDTQICMDTEMQTGIYTRAQWHMFENRHTCTHRDVHAHMST